MYRRALRAVAPQLLFIALLGVAAGVLVTYAAGWFGVPDDGPAHYIFSVSRSVGLGLLGSIVIRRTLETLADSARSDLSAVAGTSEWVPAMPESVLAFHWMYRRSDEATREIFTVLIEESSSDTPPRKVLRAAKALAREVR